MLAAAKRSASAAIILAYAVSIAVYTSLPEPHWQVPGAFRPEFGRLMIAFVLPSAAAVLYLLFNGLIKDAGTSEPPATAPYSNILLAILLFVIGLHAILLVGLLGGERAVGTRAPLILTGLAFLFVGNLLPQTRPNPFIGIRTRATLASREAWMQLHRLVGYTSVAFGTVLIASAFVSERDRVRNVVSAAAAIGILVCVIGYRKQMQSRIGTARAISGDLDGKK